MTPKRVSYSTSSSVLGFVHQEQSIFADPLFVDAAHYDFHLQAKSPAIGHAVKTSAYFDASGNSIPQDQPQDIGAYVFTIQTASISLAQLQLPSFITFIIILIITFFK